MDAPIDFAGELNPEQLAAVTAPDGPLLILAAAGTGGPIGFGGVSDLFHVRDVPGIVLGPGRPEQSHKADEWVEIEQLERAVHVYRDLARGYLTGGDA